MPWPCSFGLPLTFTWLAIRRLEPFSARAGLPGTGTRSDPLAGVIGLLVILVFPPGIARLSDHGRDDDPPLGRLQFLDELFHVPMATSLAHLMLRFMTLCTSQCSGSVSWS